MLNDHPIMIACVTFETAMIVEPARFFETRDIHLFSYMKDPEGDGAIYGEFNNEVVRQLRDAIPGIDIGQYKEHPVYYLDDMVREISNAVSDIRRYAPDTQILINVSAGSRMFAVAGAIVSMRCRNVDIFTVGTKDYTVKFDEISKLYFKDGKPVGLTEHCHDPKVFEKLDMMYDDEQVIRGLQIFIRFYDEHRSSYRLDVIRTMKDSGILSKDYKLDLNHYERDFKEIWVEKGWVELEPKKSRRYRPTEKGRRMAATFYTR